jgi:hypothetical protein
VHNVFTQVDIPYPAVGEAIAGRRGVAVRTVAGRAIPVVALAHSAMAEMLTGNAVARLAVGEVNARADAGYRPPGETVPPISRTVKVPVVAALAGAVVVAVAAVWFVA